MSLAGVAVRWGLVLSMQVSEGWWGAGAMVPLIMVCSLSGILMNPGEGERMCKQHPAGRFKVC